MPALYLQIKEMTVRKKSHFTKVPMFLACDQERTFKTLTNSPGKKVTIQRSTHEEILTNRRHKGFVSCSFSVRSTPSHCNKIIANIKLKSFFFLSFYFLAIESQAKREHHTNHKSTVSQKAYRRRAAFIHHFHNGSEFVIPLYLC